MLNHLERVWKVSESAIERGGEKEVEESQKGMNGIVWKESSRIVAAEKLVRNTSDSSSRKLIVHRMKRRARLTD